MGHMDVVSFISKGLNVYYPMTILLVCFCTYFNIGSRILHCFGVQQFLVDEELVTEYVNEGRDIVRRGKHQFCCTYVSGVHSHYCEDRTVWYRDLMKLDSVLYITSFIKY